jgi:hypothetical protein
MSVLTRIARPYTTFKEHGEDDEDLIQHCEACFKSGPGTVDRMRNYLDAVEKNKVEEFKGLVSGDTILGGYDAYLADGHSEDWLKPELLAFSFHLAYGESTMITLRGKTIEGSGRQYRIAALCISEHEKPGERDYRFFNNEEEAKAARILRDIPEPDMSDFDDEIPF